MQEKELIQELSKGLIKWYEFHDGSRALFVSGGIESCDGLGNALEECGLIVDCININTILEKWEKDFSTYKYILLVGALERSKNPVVVLRKLHELLDSDGYLLLGMDNRLGIRYFCGEKDQFTQHIFDSIENYVKVNVNDKKNFPGRAYAKAEIIQMLKEAGFDKNRFYSVLPQLSRPQVLYAEDYLPEEELDVRVVPQYNSPNTVFLEEERLYTTLVQNGLFHAMANGYFVECSLNGIFSNVKQVTISMDRGKINGLLTMIRRDNKVEKRALYAQGQQKLKQLYEYTLDLKNHGVKMVDAELKDEAYIMPYVKGEPATKYLRRLLYEDMNLFLQELDRFWEIIKHSSEPVPYEEVDWENFDPAWQYGEGKDIERDKWRKIAFSNEEGRENIGIILNKGYIDLVSLNCFYINGDFVFYDQEFYINHLPAKAILMRTIDFIYWGESWNSGWRNTQAEAIMPREKLQERYHLNKYQGLWHAFSDYFMYNLTNGKVLSQYHMHCRRNSDVVKLNRIRMDYTEDEYGHFQNIFENVDGKKLYVFGSGAYSKKFISRFGKKYKIDGILDNDSTKWGTELLGIKIMSPDHLCGMLSGTYKIIICVQDCYPIMKQLKNMRIKDYSIYDYKMESIRESLNNM